MLIGYLYIFFREISIQILCSFKNRVVFFYCCVVSYQIYRKNFSHFLLSFHFLDGVLEIQKFFILMKFNLPIFLFVPLFFLKVQNKSL